MWTALGHSSARNGVRHAVENRRHRGHVGAPDDPDLPSPRPARHVLMLVDNVTVSPHRSGMAQFVRFANGGQHGLQHSSSAPAWPEEPCAPNACVECRATGHEAPKIPASPTVTQFQWLRQWQTIPVSA